MIPWRVLTLNRISDLFRTLERERAGRRLELSAVVIGGWEEHGLEKDDLIND